MILSKGAWTGFIVVIAAGALAFPLYRLQQGNPSIARDDISMITQLNRSLHGRQLQLPSRDYFGSPIPKGEVQMELVQPCVACSVGTARYSINPSHEKTLPIVLLFREESVLRTVKVRAKNNVFLILERDLEVAPSVAWSAAPIALSLSDKGKVVSVHNKRALFVENIQQVKK